MPLSQSELESVYRDIERPLYNFALRWVFNPALAEEVVHEAFIRIWRRQGSVDSATVKGLLYKTVQRLALNEMRNRRLREAVPIVNWFWPAVDRGPEGDAILGQDLATMQRLLQDLPLELREVLLLSQFSDLSYEQIAQTLEIPAGTVASRKNRALHWLREQMQKNGYANSGGQDEQLD